LTEHIINILDKVNNKKFDVKTDFCFENSNRIVFKQYIDSKDRFIFVKYINERIKRFKQYEHVELITLRSAKDYCFKIKNCKKRIYVLVKPRGKRSKVSCHEFLTAACVLLGVETIPNNEQDITQIYSNIQKIVKKRKIANYSIKELNLIEYDYTSLCQAISASRYILKNITSVPERAYITANNWHKHVSFLKCKNNDIKNYNSADIIFKNNKQYFGISLKRKECITSKDPPLINRSLLSIFNNDLYIKTKLTTIIEDYFINVLNEHYYGNIIHEHSNKNNWKKHISEIDISSINEVIKNDKCILWKNIRTIIFENSDIICNDLIKYILRIDLLNLKKFEFNTITGIGRYKNSNKCIVENAETFPLKRVNEVYENFIKNKKCEI
jgi:hypothetical protein